MADEEAAFLSSMQAANEAAGYENGEGSEEQAASSSDEYDPTQAVQTDLRPLQMRKILLSKLLPMMFPSLTQPHLRPPYL